jgi:hypothetical protein
MRTREIGFTVLFVFFAFIANYLSRSVSSISKAALLSAPFVTVTY